MQSFVSSQNNDFMLTTIHSVNPRRTGWDMRYLQWYWCLIYIHNIQTLISEGRSFRKITPWRFLCAAHLYKIDFIYHLSLAYKAVTYQTTLHKQHSHCSRNAENTFIHNRGERSVCQRREAVVTLLSTWKAYPIMLELDGMSKVCTIYFAHITNVERFPPRSIPKRFVYIWYILSSNRSTVNSIFVK